MNIGRLSAMKQEWSAQRWRIMIESHEHAKSRRIETWARLSFTSEFIKWFHRNKKERKRKEISGHLSIFLFLFFRAKFTWTNKIKNGNGSAEKVKTKCRRNCKMKNSAQLKAVLMYSCCITFCVCGCVCDVNSTTKKAAKIILFPLSFLWKAPLLLLFTRFIVTFSNRSKRLILHVYSQCNRAHRTSKWIGRKRERKKPIESWTNDKRSTHTQM